MTGDATTTDERALELSPEVTLGSSPSRVLLPVGLITVASFVVANLAEPLPRPVGYALVGLAGAALGLTMRGPDAGLWALGVIPGSAAVGSPLVPGTLCYAPVGAAAAAAVTRLAVDRSWRSLPWRLPPRRVTIPAAAYLTWTGVAAITATDPVGPVGSAVGTVAALVALLVVLPTLIGDRGRLAALVVVGTTSVLAAATLLLWAVGPVEVLGRAVGDFDPNQLVWRHEALDVVLPRASGIFGTPGYQSLAVMAGLVVLVAHRTLLGRRWVLWAAVVLHVVALAMTMSRGGWVGVVLGSLVVAAHDLSRRRLRAAPLVTVLVFGTFLVLVTASMLGTIDLSARRFGGQEQVGDVDEDDLSRGGVELKSRVLLWEGSIDAISEKPVLGHGPGRNAPAIAPYVPKDKVGLGSHNTVLRVAVETGIPGAIAFVTLLVAGLWVAARHAVRAADPWALGLASAAIALTATGLTETLLFGGLAFANLMWALALGLVMAASSES